MPSYGEEKPTRPAGKGDLLEMAKSASSFAVIGLFILACFYTLYLTADFMIPVAIAIMLNLILSPIPRFLGRHGVRPSISAAIVVISLMGLFIGAFYSLAEPMADWIGRIPEISKNLENKAAVLKKPIEDVQKASEKVEKIADVEDNKNASAEVVVKKPSLLSKLFGSLRYFAVQMALIFVLLYFMLAVGDLFKRKLIKVMPSLPDKLKAERITTEIEVSISRYLFTITLINAGLGAATGLGLYLIDMPNPLLWGIMAALLNFVPYLGAIAGIVIVGIVAMMTFDNVSHALLAPAIYAGLDILEAQIITPAILSQRLTLNPVVVFLTVAFWAWFWGVPGALMAVPLLVILKIICDHIESLQAIGEFLGGDKKHRLAVASQKWDAEK